APTLPPRSLAIARRFLSNDTRLKIQQAVETTPVVLFMKGTPEQPQCGFSKAAIQVLEMQGVPTEKFKSYNVLEDSELRTAIKEFSDWPTIPQLYVGGEFVGGCDILLSMHQSGELEQLLSNKGVVPSEAEPSAQSTQP
ncbi:hypothetical protein PHLGIDRAFT_75037, partial [Phlebiopsis gigantea 11061_1 CR5-6]